MKEYYFSFDAMWLSVNGGGGEIYIRSQSHRGSEFTPEGDRYLADNGMSVMSVAEPALHDRTVFVRGAEGRNDSKPIKVYTPKDFRRVIEALQGYKAACEKWNEDARGEVAFWMVWSPQGDAPTYKHSSEAGAIAEADRLKALQPERSFFVLRAEGWMDKVKRFRRIDRGGNVPF